MKHWSTFLALSTAALASFAMVVALAARPKGATPESEAADGDGGDLRVRRLSGDAVASRREWIRFGAGRSLEAVCQVHYLNGRLPRPLQRDRGRVERAERFLLHCLSDVIRDACAGLSAEAGRAAYRSGEVRNRVCEDYATYAYAAQRKWNSRHPDERYDLTVVGVDMRAVGGLADGTKGE